MSHWEKKAHRLHGAVWEHAADPKGSMVLQELLQFAPPEVKRQMARELEGHVKEAWQSPHAAPSANFVLQKCIEVLPNADCAFVLKEMCGDAVVAACNKYGCRILQRLIEHFPHEAIEELVEAMWQGSIERLLLDRFGNFVLQCLLEHGSLYHKQRIAEVLLKAQDEAFDKLIRHISASHIVQSAMKHCSDSVQEELVRRVLRAAARDPRLKATNFGSYVTAEARRLFAKLHPAESKDWPPTPAPVATAATYAGTSGAPSRRSRAPHRGQRGSGAGRRSRR